MPELNKPTGSTQLRCLLIAPLSFYSFHRTVAEGLERRDYSVDVLNEEYPANTFGKILGKLALPALRFLTLRALRLRLDHQPRYDLVLIIKGRGLSPQALLYLRSKADRVIGYNFDSFRFNPSPLDWYQLADRYATFDIQDAKVFHLPLVHLFSAVVVPLATVRLYDLSIIQRVHSDRLSFADLLLKSLPANAQSFVFLYESSPLTFLLGVLRYPRLYARLWPHISFKPMSYMRAMEVMGKSRVTFDYAHPKQSGVTIRCFEALSLGVSVLTNNPEAVNCGLFSPGTIAYLPKIPDVKNIMTLLSNLMQRQPDPRCRSLDDFLDNLLSDAPYEASSTINTTGKFA